MVGLKSNERLEYSFNVKMLMNDVRLKVGEEAVRKIEAATGVSAATISRLNNGSMPDMETFMQLCSRCQLKPENYFDIQVWKLMSKSEREASG